MSSVPESRPGPGGLLGWWRRDVNSLDLTTKRERATAPPEDQSRDRACHNHISSGCHSPEIRNLPPAAGAASISRGKRFVAHAWTPIFHIGGAERMREGGFYSQGMSDAWITSGTPWPPTDLMARSTSFSPNLWVVTFSSGKRFEASCASASSHALKLWPRALLMVMNFTVTFSSGKLGNSFISP